MRPLRLRLFWKLGLTYLSLLLFALGAVYFFTGSIVEQNFIESSVDRLDALFRLAERRLPSLEDRSELAAWTDWLGRSGARVTVIASDGLVLADSEEDPARMENHAGRPEIREAFTSGRGISIRFSNTVKRDLVYVAVRYDDWGASPVVLRVAESLGRINEAVADVRRPVGTVTVVMLLVGGIASLLFSRALSSRVNSLQALAKRVAAGDFRLAPPDRGGDELSDLASAMNDTAAKLESSIRSLSEERNQSATILGSMSEGVAVVGPEGRIRYLNRAFRASLGLGGATWEEFRDRPLVDVVREPTIIRLASRALESSEPGESEITLGTRPARQLLVRTAPVRAAEEGGAVIVLLDVTEIHRLERVRRDFVANVSHELKTPLTAIQGFAETLLAGALEDSENNRRFLGIIRDHAERLGRLTDDLLKLSRLEAGTQEPRFEMQDLSPLIESVVETSRLKAEPKSIELAVGLGEGIPTVCVDGHWFSEILQNLIDNAIQYTSEGGHIQVRARFENGSVRIDVADDGLGIPRESQQRIFERFYRVDTARSREVGGTGLGLAIARHLTEAMGGSIAVESEPGAGSTFTIAFPSEGLRASTLLTEN